VPLVFRKRIDELEQHRPLLDFVLDSRLFKHIGGYLMYPCRTLPSVGHRISSDSQEPSRKWHPPPFETANVRECVVEDFCCQVFRNVAVTYTMRDVGINAMEVTFVEFGEAARITLCRLHQEPLISFGRKSPQSCVLRGTPSSLT